MGWVKQVRRTEYRIGESLYRTPETNTTLHGDYTGFETKNKKEIKGGSAVSFPFLTAWDAVVELEVETKKQQV